MDDDFYIGSLMDDDQKRVVKAALKEALKEWLDDKFSTFGKWSAASIAATALAAMAFLILWANGWHK